jgi:cobalt/nickel transport system permease protein
MHIADGILPTVWCGVAHGATWVGVWKLSQDLDPAEVVRMGLLASVTFAISLIHFPLGGTSVHLGLYGFTGILLGWRAFPVIVAALVFQAFLFQHGGLLSLGMNAINMGAGAAVSTAVWRHLPLAESLRAAMCGFMGILVPALLLATEFSLAGYGRGFYVMAVLYVGAAALEGGLTAGIVMFLRRTRPGVLA